MAQNCIKAFLEIKRRYVHPSVGLYVIHPYTLDSYSCWLSMQSFIFPSSPFLCFVHFEYVDTRCCTSFISFCSRWNPYSGLN